MFEKLKEWLFPSCKHDKNYRFESFFNEDGTPMSSFQCYNCGYKDEGHVYAMSLEDYKRLEYCVDGKITRIW